MLVKLLKSVRISIYDAIEHDGIEHAGYLAYLLMLAILPFLLFFAALLSFIGEDAITSTLIDLILESSWANFIDTLRPRIQELAVSPPQSLLTLAVISAIWTASSIFEALRTILNKVQRVKTYPAYIFRRLLSIVEFMCTIAVTILMVLILIVLPGIWNALYAMFSKYEFLMIILAFLGPEGKILRYSVLLFFIFFLTSCLYYFLPNVKQRFVSTFPGSLAVLMSWILFSYVFKYYIGVVHSINIIYGSIAGVIIALLYFYICSFIFIVGAELNYQVQQIKKD